MLVYIPGVCLFMFVQTIMLHLFATCICMLCMFVCIDMDLYWYKAARVRPKWTIALAASD